MKRVFSVLYPAFLLIALAIPASCCATPAWVLQETEKTVSGQTTDPSQLGSLLKVPQSAGIYFATMNHQSLVDAVADSNAWKSILDSDVSRGMKRAYRRGKTRGYADYNENNPFAIYLKGYGETIDNFMVKSGLEVVKQVFGNEMFVYIDSDMIPVGRAVQNFQTEIFEIVGAEDIQALETGAIGDRGEEIVRIFRKHFAGVECPTMIMGTRLENADEFRGLLELTRSAAEDGMDGLPPEMDFIRDAWKIVDEKDHYLLSMNIDLEELPWDELLQTTEDAEMATTIRNMMANKRASVALGIVDNLLMFGIARDIDRSIKFDDGPRLIDLPQLERLKTAVDQGEAVTSVFYISEEYALASNSLAQLIRDQVPTLKSVILADEEFGGDNREALANQIGNDLEEFADDIESLQPRAGMSFGFTKLSDDGIHGYRFQQPTHPGLDGSKPLNLTRHAGSNTVAFMVQRPANLTRQYEFGSKWASKLYGYTMMQAMDEIADAAGRAAGRAAGESEAGVDDADDAAEGDQAAEDNHQQDLKQSPEQERAKVLALFKGFEKCAASIDRTTREELLPAIEGQEAGLFIELVSDSKAWHPDWPNSTEPLPLPLPAVVLGTSDAAKVIQAYEAYWVAVDQFVELVKQIAQESHDVDNIAVTPPTRTTTEKGTSFRWNLLSEYAEIDTPLKVGSLVAKDVIVMNLHAGQAEQLAKEGKANVFGPAASKDPSFNLVFFDNRILMKGLSKWGSAEFDIPGELDYDLDLSKYEAERDTLQFSEAQLEDAGNRIWSLLECWKGFSARSYPETDGAATEFWFKFEDIPSQK